MEPRSVTAINASMEMDLIRYINSHNLRNFKMVQTA